MGRLGLAIASGFGLGALCYYGLGLSSEVGTLDKAAFWPAHVQQRIHSTYGRNKFYSSLFLNMTKINLFRIPGWKLGNYCGFGDDGCAKSTADEFLYAKWMDGDFGHVCANDRQRDPLSIDSIHVWARSEAARLGDTLWNYGGRYCSVDSYGWPFVGSGGFVHGGSRRRYQKNPYAQPASISNV